MPELPLHVGELQGGRAGHGMQMDILDLIIGYLGYIGDIDINR